MERNYFRYKLFDLLNESDELEIADPNAEDRKNLLTVRTEDGWKNVNGRFIMDKVLSKKRRHNSFSGKMARTGRI